MGGGGGGGLLGGVTQTLFGDGGAAAAQAAAMEQQGQARGAFGKISSIADQMTTQGLAGYDKALTAQSNNLSRQEEMVKQIDPTVLAASQQALKLINGQQSSTLAPIQAQRDQQRANLMNTLRSQMGPGAETSTAGRQALNNFDMQTNSLLGQQQQSALGQLGNTFGQFSGYGQQLNQTIGQMANITGQRADLQGRQAGLYQQAYNPMIQTAGADQVAATMRGQQNAAFGQQMFGAALPAIGGAISSGFGSMFGGGGGGTAVGASGPQLTFK